jgi:hypothetical protein
VADIPPLQILLQIPRFHIEFEVEEEEELSDQVEEVQALILEEVGVIEVRRF